MNHPTPEGNEMLQIAQNLARIYAHVLEEQLPPELVSLIDRLEQRRTGSKE